MGRPENCNCCDDFGDPPLPPITSCDDVICIALIDENNNSNGRDTADAKFAEWVKAFPNRILFVVDVFLGKPNNPDGTPKLYFPDGWDDHNYAFNLRGEFQRGVSVPEFCNRDNGNVGFATDVWAALSTIVADRGLTTDFNNATEVSVFVDISRSMPEGTVQAAYNLLVSELESAGKTLVSSISNTEEDYLCPFVTSSCCPNEFVKALQDLCNVSSSCEPAYLKLTNNSIYTGRTNFLIREYIDYDPDNPPSNGWYGTYGGVERVYALEYAGAGTAYEANTTDYRALTAETNDQQLVVLTEVTNSEGASLDFVDINYVIEYSDDSGSTWTQIDDLGNTLSGQTLTKKFLVDDYGGSSASAETVHSLLGDTVSSYTDYNWEGRIKARRIYSRRFRIVASAPDYPALTPRSLEFRLEEYRVAGRTGATGGGGGGGGGSTIETSFLIDEQSLGRIFLNTSLFEWFNNVSIKQRYRSGSSRTKINGIEYTTIPTFVSYGIEYKVGGEYVRQSFQLGYEYRDPIDLDFSSSTGSCSSSETFYTKWFSGYQTIDTGESNFDGLGFKRERLNFARYNNEDMSNSMYRLQGSGPLDRLLADDAYPFHRSIDPRGAINNRYNSSYNDPKQRRRGYAIDSTGGTSSFDRDTRDAIISTACFRGRIGTRSVSSQPLFRLESFEQRYFLDAIRTSCINCGAFYYKTTPPSCNDPAYIMQYVGAELLRTNREYRLVATMANSDVKIYSPVFQPLFFCYDQRLNAYPNQYIQCGTVCEPRDCS